LNCSKEINGIRQQRKKNPPAKKKRKQASQKAARDIDIKVKKGWHDIAPRAVFCFE
jgi:hypothetical protein